MIEGFNTPDANYQIALKLLAETYGRKDLIINNHVSKLINIEKQDNKDKKSLRTIYNKVCSHVRALEAPEVTAEEYSIF